MEQQSPAAEAPEDHPCVSRTFRVSPQKALWSGLEPITVIEPLTF